MAKMEANNFSCSTLPLEGRFGPMDFTYKIYQFSDKETKANLKMVNKTFWRIHSAEKFFNNYSNAQTPYTSQLYCYKQDCVKRELFESCFSPSLKTTDRGEICPIDSPRSRQGWPIVYQNSGWGKAPPPRKIREWPGCQSCWDEFVRERPEYDVIEFYPILQFK